MTKEMDVVVCSKEVREMTLMNRMLFAELIENKEFAELCISIILEDEHVLKLPPQAEKEIRNLEVGKFIRIDSFFEDDKDNTFDLEVQQYNEYDLPKRSRHYQGTVDSRLLKSGEKTFNEMNNTYIIFISAFDPFGKKKYCYQFSNSCENVEGVSFNDGGKRIFLNTKGKDDGNISDELKWMLRYFEETTDEVAELSKNRRIRRMNEMVNEVKESAEFNRKVRDRLEDLGRAERKGIETAHVEDAKKFKAKGIALDIIAECTGLPLATVEAI